MNELKILLLLVLLTAVPAVGVSQVKTDPDAEPQVKVLGTYTNRYKMVNKYVLVAKGLTEDELIELASNLHRNERDVSFWFLDDGSKSSQMLGWIKAYGEGKADATEPIFDWIADHTVANLQPWVDGKRGKFWVLSKGIGMVKIAEIE